MIRAVAILALIASCASQTSTGTLHASLAAAPGINVLDLGARGDGISDDRVALQAAIDACAKLACPEVLIPNGRYAVSGTAGARCLGIPAGIHLRGESRDGTVIVQMPGTGPSVRLLHVFGPDVTIESMTLDGGKATQTIDEHRAGIFATGAPRLTIRHVAARDFTGDGFYVYNGSSDVTIDDTLATGNARNGLTFGGGTVGGLVTGSTFRGNGAQQVDSETGPGATIDGLTLTGNVMDGGGVSSDYALTISGSGSASRSRGWRVERNVINGGAFVVWASGVAIVDNVGINPTPKPSVTVYRSSDHVSIRRNRFTMTQALVDDLGVVTVIGTGTGNAPSRVLIEDNDLEVRWRARSFGVRVAGALDVDIEGNRITGAGMAGPGAAGVYLRATNEVDPFRSAIVRRNRISNFGELGISVRGNGAAKLLALDIADNVFDDDAATPTMTTAISLDDGTGAAQSISVTGNLAIGGVAKAVVRYPATATPWIAFPTYH